MFSKSYYSNGYVCQQIYSSVSDKEIALAIESISGYSVVFTVFVENIILIILLTTRKQIQVSLINLLVRNTYITPSKN